MSLRVRIIQKLISINEQLVFYPQLKNFYTRQLTSQALTIIDVGSNKGQTIDFFISLNPNATILAFEPNPILYTLLKQRYTHNHAITVYPAGISSINGRLKFHQNILDETSSFEEVNAASVYLKRKARILGIGVSELNVRTYDVDVITLHSFLVKNQSLKIDVLKIDVEGHELNCLKGLFESPAMQYPIRFIQLESHQDDMYLSANQQEEIHQLLITHGFTPVKKIRHGFGKFFELIYKNTQDE